MTPLPLPPAMFSLFVCVTQDGWVNIFRELNACGNAVLGAIYLLIFITIGAFVFANLVVAVVVTNLVSKLHWFNYMYTYKDTFIL